MRRKKKQVKKPHGRPSKLTASIQRKICEAVALGCTYSIAANFAGIHESTLFAWLARGRDGDEGIYKDFYRVVKHAEAQSAIRALDILVKASEDDWRAAAFILERRHKFTKDADRPSIDITVDVQASEVVTLIDEVRQHALQDVIEGPVIDLDEE
jgi:hypothetical protein|tara:strand:- start:2055 stop:2519 length:465 start_codon:yes stop_codon:yes gene_type:complete